MIASVKESNALYGSQSLLNIFLIGQLNVQLNALIGWVHFGRYWRDILGKFWIDAYFITMLVHNSYVKSIRVRYGADDPSRLVFGHFDRLILIRADLTPVCIVVAIGLSCMDQ